VVGAGAGAVIEAKRDKGEVTSLAEEQPSPPMLNRFGGTCTHAVGTGTQMQVLPARPYPGS